MQKTRKSTGDLIIFGKTKQKDKSTREKEGKKRRKQKSIGEQTRPIEIKGRAEEAHGLIKQSQLRPPKVVTFVSSIGNVKVARLREKGGGGWVEYY